MVRKYKGRRLGGKRKENDLQRQRNFEPEAGASNWLVRIKGE